MSSSKKIPHPHLPAVSHPKTLLEKSTDLHVAQVGNRHDSHFRDIVTTTRTKQTTMTDCVAVYNLPLEVEGCLHRYLANLFNAIKSLAYMKHNEVPFCYISLILQTPATVWGWHSMKGLFHTTEIFSKL